MTREEYNVKRKAGKWNYIDLPISQKIEIAKASSESIRLITFQDPMVWSDVVHYGHYVPSAGLGDTKHSTKVLADKLGYFPVWAFNPLSAMTYKFNPFWFTSSQFNNIMWQNFQRRYQYEWKDFAMFELQIPTSHLNEVNTTDWVTAIPEIKKEQVIAIYQFFIRDMERECPTTDDLPYIKVLRLFDKTAMLTEDFAPALWSGKYTGDDIIDFNL